MSTDVADLVMRFRSDEARTAEQRLDRLDRAAGRAERGAGNLERRSGGLAAAFRGLTRVVAPLATALAAAFSVRGLSRTLQGLDEIAKQARSIDATANALRATQLAMTEAGVSSAEAVSGMQRLNRELARAARGAGNGADALSRIGLTVQDLQSLDADERFAILADAIQDTGLNAGETSDLLRELGVRSREMALAMIDGGDAFREARQELRRLGLELSDTDLRAVEEANDAMARMGLVARSLGQQIAITLAPALQSMAVAFSNIMGEGQAFRAFAESIGRILSGWVTIITQSVEGINALAGAFVGAEYAALALVAALVALRWGLIRTGYGALIVGLGEAAYQFDRLVDATGSFGEALEVMGNVAREVLVERIPLLAGGMLSHLRARWEQMKADWLRALDEMLSTFRGWAEAVGGALKMVPGFQGFGIALEQLATASDGFGASIARLEHESDRFDRIGAGLVNAAMEPLKALEDLRDRTRETGDETDKAAEAARRYKEALEELGGAGAAGGAGGGGAIGTATDGMDAFRDSLQQTDQVMSRLRDGMANAFASIITGASSARDAIRQLLQQMASMLANRGFSMLFDAVFGAFGRGPSLGGGSWNIGGFNVPSLDFAPASAGPSMAAMPPSLPAPAMAPSGGGQPGRMDVSIGFDESIDGFRATVRDETGRIVAQGVQQGIRQNERKALPKSMQRIQRNPRDIG